MDHYEIKRIYKEKKDRDAALKAYAQAIEENKADENKMKELAFLAADFAHAEALKLLFDAGVSPSVTDKYGFTLLHALAKQEESKYDDHVKPKGSAAETTLLLLDSKVSVLVKDKNESMVCYHYAARNGLVEMVETLAARGAKLNMTDREGNTGIHIACEYARYPISSIESKKKRVEDAKKACEEKRVHFFKLAEQSGKSKEWDAAQAEAEFKKYAESNLFITPEYAQKEYDSTVQRAEDYFRLVKIFAEGGVDITEKNSIGLSALDVAVKGNAKKIAAYLSGTLVEGDDSALAAGGMTLHQAAEKGDAEAIKAIAATGADLNAVNDEKKGEFAGCTALSIAVAQMHAGAAEALLACGADPSFKDGSGRAAPHFFFPGRKISEKDTKKIIKDMISAGMSVDLAVDDDSDTLLIWTCRNRRGSTSNGHSVKGDVLDELMKHNPNINLANRFGVTTLMYVCADDDLAVSENLQTTLLEQGADVSAADKNGNTALHYAARNSDKNGAKTLCDMLLEFGADANAVNNAKQTALDIATENSNEPLVKLLLSKM